MKLRRETSPKTASQILAKELAAAEFALKEKLVAAREAAGLKQTDVAEALGVDKSTISRFERLDSNPTLSMIRYYAHTVGVLVTYDVVEGAASDAPSDQQTNAPETEPTSPASAAPLAQHEGSLVAVERRAKSDVEERIQAIIDNVIRSRSASLHPLGENLPEEMLQLVRAAFETPDMQSPAEVAWPGAFIQVTATIPHGAVHTANSGRRVAEAETRTSSSASTVEMVNQ